MKVYQRTENGTTTEVSVGMGRTEINTAMMEGKRAVREMSAAGSNADILYKDGTRVRLILIDSPRLTRTTVTVKGKSYIATGVVPASEHVTEAYKTYWSERNGKTFGASRFASASDKPGTVGRAIWDAVNK